VLEANEAKLGIKRYAEAFFEIFIVGGIMQPGGLIPEQTNIFSIFATQPEATEIKARVAVIE
jgi:hypothetical protein